jgi:hypothetical protein
MTETNPASVCQKGEGDSEPKTSVQIDFVFVGQTIARKDTLGAKSA